MLYLFEIILKEYNRKKDKTNFFVIFTISPN